MDIPPFGEIDADALEEYYETALKIKGKKVELDLNFESESVDEEVLASVESFIHELSVYAKRAWLALEEDWDLDAESDTTRFYLQHHLDDMDEAEALALFGTKDVSKQVFFDALSLVRIGLYPEDEDAFAVFDIQFSREITDYLLTVRFSVDGEVSDVSFES